MRTFIAIDIAEETQAALRTAQKAMGRLGGVRWADPDDIHLTLKFIGEIEDARLPGVFAAMRKAALGVAPFEFAVKGLGWFPPGRRPRVIWAGVEGAAEMLAGVVRKLDNELGELGVPPEARAFKPHLTLGRANGRIDASVVEEAFARLSKREFGQELAEELVLYMSELLPSGARYTRLGATPLGGGTEEAR